jgi:hypothetical protein
LFCLEVYHQVNPEEGLVCRAFFFERRTDYAVSRGIGYRGGNPHQVARFPFLVQLEHSELPSKLF